MLQVSVLRQKKEWVKERLSLRNFRQPELVDEIIALDDERKKLQAEFDSIQAKINTSSKEIGKLMGAGKKDEAEQLKTSVTEWKRALDPIKQSTASVERKLQETIIALPNLPSELVPKGSSPEDNEVVREGGKKPALGQDALPHWELAKKYGLIDFELGTKITGSG
ncbi:MAG TPA: serine--tRNA ligase, partial [Parafilimonas sp.]|nr:serine--tRNA ligase [Parafilimonas sp.]